MTYKWEAMVEDLTVERDNLKAALQDLVSLIEAYPRFFSAGEVNMVVYLKAANKALKETT